MRIVAVQSWLLAALTLRGPAASQATVDTVVFDPYQGFNITEKKAAVISPQEGISFRWNIIATDNVNIKAVTLYYTPTNVDLATNSKQLGIGYPQKSELPVRHVRNEGIPSKTADVSEPGASSIILVGK